MSRIKIVASVASHKGKFRKSNQDNFLLNGISLPDETKALNDVGSLSVERGKEEEEIEQDVYETVSKAHLQIYAVFDGLGGESYGREAAQIAASLASYYLEKLKDKVIEDIDHYINLYFLDANEQICKMATAKKAKASGSTAALVCFYKNTFYCANIGDTKIYLYRNHSLEQLSVDHVESALLKKVLALKEDVKSMMGNNQLTQYLGIDTEEMLIEPYYFKLEPRKGDILLLCSDGLTEKMDQAELKVILEDNQDVSMATKKLLEKATQLNTKDNRTAMLLQVCKSFF